MKQELLQNLLSSFFPKDIVDNFELSDIVERGDYLEIHFKELSELSPENMPTSREIILDGYCNALELQSFPLNGKAVYLKIHRRRWKCKGNKKHYFNHYDFHPSGVKATKEFASFLKEAYGSTPDQYNRDIKVSLP